MPSKTEPAAPLVAGGSDPSSYSNPAAARITHTDMEIDVDFDAHVLHCWGAHSVTVKQDGATELILDTRALTVHSVTVDGKPVSAHRGPSSDALGAALVVPLPSGLRAGTTLRVEMVWDTSPEAMAVQWLKPEMTVGGRHPYLFTQCQAIHARSLCPCHDTPGAKFTYTAAVRVPTELVPLMSALPDDSGDAAADLTHVHQRPSSGDTKVWRFTQPLPISSYLIALAVGDLASRDLSPNSRVWSEPSVVDAAAHEFEDTPKYLEAAEALAGPYRWGRYDLLCLPSSFPYGGMENPNVTFVTPTLLAGDKSLANVVAHEIAHSWTGNLVTNRDWSAFFLNEGWTMWLERRIQGYLANEKVFQFQASLGWGELVETVNTWGKDHPYTRLVPDLSAGVDPDDAFSRIPYEKGFALLYYLETLVGGKDAFISFFKDYVQHFADTPLTPDDFRVFFTDYFEQHGVHAVREVDWDAWYYGLGMPPVTNEYDDSLAQEAYDLAKKWHTCDVMGLGSDGPEGASEADIKGWSSEQVVAFLDRLGELRSMTPLNPRTTRAMAKAYPILESSKNAEIRCAWYLLCIKAGDKTVLPMVTEFLEEQGRMKYVRPLYRALRTSGKLDGGRQVAVETFEKVKRKYHPICAKMCAVDLQLAPKDAGGEA